MHPKHPEIKISWPNLLCIPRTSGGAGGLCSILVLGWVCAVSPSVGTPQRAAATVPGEQEQCSGYTCAEHVSSQPPLKAAAAKSLGVFQRNATGHFTTPSHVARPEAVP